MATYVATNKLHDPIHTSKLHSIFQLNQPKRCSNFSSS